MQADQVAGYGLHVGGIILANLAVPNWWAVGTELKSWCWLVPEARGWL